MRVGGLDVFQDSQQCPGPVSVLGDRLVDQQALVSFKTFTCEVVGRSCHVPSLPGAARIACVAPSACQRTLREKEQK